MMGNYHARCGAGEKPEVETPEAYLSLFALPDDFCSLLSTMRSREISSIIIIQNFAQLKALFKDTWETIPGNCDTFIYLGGNEQSTHKYVSELLGKGTIDKKSSGETKGRQGSSSRNYDVLGRELFTPDEVRKLDNKKCIIFIRGFDPIMDNKFIPFNHPMFNQTADGKGEPYVHEIKGANNLIGPPFEILSDKAVKYYEKLKDKGENVYIDSLTYEQFMMLGDAELSRRFSMQDEAEQKAKVDREQANELEYVDESQKADSTATASGSSGNDGGTLNALSAADSVIIPVQAQYLPAKGMTQLVQTISKVKKYINPDIKIDGMLLTLVDSRTNLAKSTVEALRANFGNQIRMYRTQIPITRPEQELFMDYLKNSNTAVYWYPVFAVMLGTGLRVGEVTGLRWCDIDLEDGIIDVNHTLVYYDHRTSEGKKGCYFNVNTPKTEAGNRQVPMLDFVKEAFVMEKQRQELLGVHCEATIDGYTDFIFLNRFGQPQHQSTLNKAIRRIIRDCNDEQFLKTENPEVLLPHFSCHSLRHTFTTRMCEAGVNIKVIQDTLGHKDITTTLNIYTDVTKELKRTEFDGLDKYFNNSIA